MDLPADENPRNVHEITYPFAPSSWADLPTFLNQNIVILTQSEGQILSYFVHVP